MFLHILLLVIIASWMIAVPVCGLVCDRPYECLLDCPLGRQYDEKGCPLCRCVDPPNYDSPCIYHICDAKDYCVAKAGRRPMCVPRPTFTRRPDSQMVREGDVINFGCDTDADPLIPIQWRFNGLPLSETLYIRASRSGTTLSIVSAQAYHAGTYTCLVQGQWGEMTATAELQVISSVKPKIDKSVSEVHATLLSSANLQCDASGDPKPYISWSRNGQSITTSMSHDKFRNGTLLFKQVQKQDEGTYMCVAENIGGSTTWNTSLNVIDPSRKAYTISTQMITKTSDTNKGYVRDAVEATDKDLNNPRKRRTPAELLRSLRYPSEPVKQMGMAADIFSMSLEAIGDDIRQTDPQNDLSPKDILNPDKMAVLSDETGCTQAEHPSSDQCTNVCGHLKYRTFNGTCNNFRRPLLGASSTRFKRLLPAQYDNEYSLPKGWSPQIKYNNYHLPSAREVSLKLVATPKVTGDRRHSHMVMQWGQFLDHDLDLTPTSVSNRAYGSGRGCNETCAFDPPCFPIPVSANDPRIKSRECLAFTRSSTACAISDSKVPTLAPRDQINSLTAFIDGGQIYGSSEEAANNLREFNPNRGLLRQGVPSGLPSGKPLLPGGNTDCLLDPTASNVPCFVAGDGRVNEQLGLIAIHTVWFREHNRVAAKLSELNPHWDGDTVYQEARKIVGAELQHITYNEWLPLILGRQEMKYLGAYNGYDVNTDASVANSFATAAFRFGHAIIHPILSRFDERFEQIPEGNLHLHQAFFTPHRILEEGGIDPVLRGFFGQETKKKLADELLTTELTERLFEMAAAVALDLAALNVQRGRDHGLPGYNDFREFYGLGRRRSFSRFNTEISDVGVLRKLYRLYGHPDNIDLWIGGLVEDNLPGGLVGPTFACIIGNQFNRTRAGDRFWYENPGVFTPAQLVELKQSNLARVLCDNSDGIHHIQINPFRTAVFPSGVEKCDGGQIPHVDLSVWADGCAR